jgi:hypothetical protein
MSLLDQLREKSNVDFRPAVPVVLDQLRSLGAPEDVLTFYRHSEPARFAEIGKVRLWPISNILVENRDAVPGCYAQPCGYVVIASTTSGDAFCSDIRTASGAIAPVVLIAHDLEPENDEMKREELAKLAKPMAASFEDFLKAFASETVDTEPLYPPFDLETPRT